MFNRLINLVVWSIIVSINTTSGMEKCYEESFDGSLGIFDSDLVSRFLFEVKKYEDYGDIEEPEGSNGYFITEAEVGDSSIKTGEGTYVPDGTEVTMYYYTSNPGDVELFRWYLLNADTGTSVNIGPIYVDDSRTWKTSTLYSTHAHNISIWMHCPDLSESGGFLAIDKITINTPTLDECVPFGPLITTTTQSTITPEVTITPAATTTTQSTDATTTSTPQTTITTPITTTAESTVTMEITTKDTTEVTSPTTTDKTTVITSTTTQPTSSVTTPTTTQTTSPATTSTTTQPTSTVTISTTTQSTSPVTSSTTTQSTSPVTTSTTTQSTSPVTTATTTQPTSPLTTSTTTHPTSVTTPATTKASTTTVISTTSTTLTVTPPTDETTVSSIDTTPTTDLTTGNPEQPPRDDSETKKWKTISIVSLTIASAEFVYAIGITAYFVINRRMQRQYETD